MPLKSTFANILQSVLCQIANDFVEETKFLVFFLFSLFVALLDHTRFTLSNGLIFFIVLCLAITILISVHLIIPGAPIPVKIPIILTAALRLSSATPDGMHQYKSSWNTIDAFLRPISSIIFKSKYYFEFLQKCYVETFYGGRQVSFRKDSLQLRRQILPSLWAVWPVSIIPAGGLLFLSRLTSITSGIRDYIRKNAIEGVLIQSVQGTCLALSAAFRFEASRARNDLQKYLRDLLVLSCFQDRPSTVQVMCTIKSAC